MSDFGHIGLLKAAEVEAAKGEMPPHPAKTFAKGIAGLGLGTAAGYLGMHGARALMGGELPSKAMQWAIPVTSGLAGLAFPYFHQALLDKMRKDSRKRAEVKGERKNT